MDPFHGCVPPKIKSGSYCQTFWEVCVRSWLRKPPGQRTISGQLPCFIKRLLPGAAAKRPFLGGHAAGPPLWAAEAGGRFGVVWRKGQTTQCDFTTAPAGKQEKRPLRLFCQKKGGRPSDAAAPAVAADEGQEGKDLQPAQKHVRREHQLGQVAEGGVVAMGPPPRKPGPILLMQANTAEKLLSSGKPSSEMKMKLANTMNQ